MPPQPRVNDAKREITLDFQNAGWLSDVGHFVISDNQWLAKKPPCLTYGLRGVAYFEVIVSGPAGSGKSALLKLIVAVRGKRVSVVAPTQGAKRVCQANIDEVLPRRSGRRCRASPASSCGPSPVS